MKVTFYYLLTEPAAQRLMLEQPGAVVRDVCDGHVRLELVMDCLDQAEILAHKWSENERGRRVTGYIVHSRK